MIESPVISGHRRFIIMALLLLAPLTLLTGEGSVSADFVPDPAMLWASDFCVRTDQCGVGDFNGDGRDDVIAFSRGQEGSPTFADVRVSLSDGERFLPSTLWSDFFCLGDEICRIGDFNGDGRDDIITFLRGLPGDPAQGNVYIALSQGDHFGAFQLWHNFFCIRDELCRVGDVNGDGRDDIISFVRNSQTEPDRGNVYVALSTGNGFGSTVLWHDNLCTGNQECHLADANGDGRDDVVAFARGILGDEAGDVTVALSNGTSFVAAAQPWHGFFCIQNEVCGTGDFNNDGRDDIVAFTRSSQIDSRAGDVSVALSSGAWFGAAQLWHDFFCLGTEICQTGDFNGDGADDIVAFVRGPDELPSQGAVYVALAESVTFRLYFPVSARAP